MKFSPTIAFTALLVAALPSFAVPVTLTFEGATSFSPIANFYSGGGGTNYHLAFSAPAVALVNDGTGPGPSGEFFSNAPSPGTVMFAPDAPAFVSVTDGLRLLNQISFYYSSLEASASAVQIYSGLNGSGTVLASANLLANSQSGCAPAPYCHWDKLTLNFSGIARSVGFSNIGFAAFDDIALNVVPEPTTALLAMVGVVGLFASSRRKVSRV